MARYIARAGNMPVTVPDGVMLPACSYERADEPAPAPKAKRKPAAKKAARKE